MTAPDRLVTPIAGGYVLLGPYGAMLLSAVLRRTEVVGRRDGVGVSRDVLALRAALEVAAEQRGSASVIETETVPSAPDPASSTTARPFPDDPIGVTEAAALLGCSTVWVRALCRRGEFVTAMRRSGCWWVERSEVKASAPGRPGADAFTETRERN